MSDLGKEKSNDNPSKIREILADFFLKKIDMPYASEDSDHLHKSKKKRSKHKKRKHKKSKHHRRSSSSNSTAELNIKGVDDISSSEEMGIKRLKKIKCIKMQSVNSLVLQSASSVSEHSELKNSNSSNEKPVFYGPSLELLLTGVDNNLVSKPDLSSKDSDDRNFSENKTKTDFNKETKKSFQEDTNRNCVKEAEYDKSSKVSLECPVVNSNTKDSCNNDNEIISTESTILSGLKSTKEANLESDVRKNNSQSFLEEGNSKINLNDCKIAVKKEEPELNIMTVDSKIEAKASKNNINENYSKTCIEENDFVSDINKKESDNTKEANLDCKYTESDNPKIFSEVNETDKKESKEECPNSNFLNYEKTKNDINHKNDANNITKSKKNDSKRKHSKSHSRSVSPANHTSSRSKHKSRRSRSSSCDSYHSKKKKRQRSQSRCYSHGKTRSSDYRRRSYSRSYSRSRSRSRYQRPRKRSHSRSPYSRYNHRRSRSRSYTRSKGSFRLRTRRRSKSREHHYSSLKYRDISRSRKRSRSKSNSRSRSQRKSVPSKKSLSRSTSKEKTKKSHSRSKSKERRSKRSRSRSKSIESRSKKSCSRSKSKERKSKKSRSRSKSKERRSKKSHSRSKSKEGRSKNSRSRSKSKERRSKKSRSRSKSKERRSKKSRSRSKSKGRKNKKSRSRSKSREKENKKSLSMSKSKERKNKKSRSRSKSKERKRKRSRSRSKSKEKKSSSEKSNKIDQAKILETARRNVLQMIKKGTLPEGLPIENLKKDQLLSIQAGGKSVQELTDFCQRLSQKENDPETSDNDEKDDKADDETGFIHHPFKVKEPGVIKLNIKNAVQLPIRTHAQKIAETTRLSSQFPVSSGNKHRQKELEWIPVIPESSKATETKTTVTTVTTVAVAETSTAVVPLPAESTVQPIPPLPPLPPDPIAYPCQPPPPPPPMEVMTTDTAISMPIVLPSTVSMPSIPPPPPPLPPIIQPTTVYQNFQPIVPSYAITVPNQEIVLSTVLAPAPSTSIFKPPKKLDISSIVTKRFQALQKLNESPNDVESLRVLQEAQESIQDWVESQQVPGLFTGSTDVKLLTVDELSGPFKHRNRKDVLMLAPPVTEGKGMSLLKKMGWNPGEGLGKNKEGSLEPLLLDIKTDKKGLVSEGENSKKGVSSFLKDLQGKHPVSALMELCSKRKWKPPLYTCVKDEGPPHKKLFIFKVEVNGVEYQPVNPCSNKKVAKADSAVLCLQSLNVLPKTT